MATNKLTIVEGEGLLLEIEVDGRKITFNAIGMTAYQLAVIHGYEGTEAEWLESLKAKSVYQLAVEQGYLGTETEFNELLGNIGEIPTALDLIIGDE